MKIVQVTTRYPPHRGGVETHVKETSERLVDRGHEVTVLTADASGELESTERRNGVLIRRHRGIAPNGAFHVAPGIVRTLQRLDADVIHAHNYHSLPLFFAALTLGEARFVVTPHYHAASANSVRHWLLSVYRPFGGWALGQADAVIAVSEWERDQLRRDFGIDATTIPNGLEVDRFRNAKPERRDRPYLLCVGRLEEYKGVQHVIRALPELEGYDLLVAGTGPYENELVRIAREENVTDRVVFLGFVDDTRLPGLYTGAEVFLALSEFEAYGMTVAEALVAGTPCVTFRRRALGEWTDRPDVVGIGSARPDEIAEAVAAARTREAPCQQVAAWDEIIEDILGVYER